MQTRHARRILALALLALALCAAEESDGEEMGGWKERKGKHGKGGDMDDEWGWKMDDDDKPMSVCADDFERLCAERIVGETSNTPDLALACMTENQAGLSAECASEIAATSSLSSAFHSSCDASLASLGCDLATQEGTKTCVAEHSASLPQPCLASITDILLSERMAPPFWAPDFIWEEGDSMEYDEEHGWEHGEGHDGQMRGPSRTQLRAGGLGALVGAFFVLFTGLAVRAVLRCRRGQAGGGGGAPVVANALPAAAEWEKASPQGSLVYQKQQGAWERPVSPGAKVSPA
uniref:WW domain-containing protein n=2 Tax=Hemiselmis andersenii TaxID=464988 RepID=A0A6T8IIT3_HEMAN|mmetsp:Transcript_19585/g.45063  ORF Transcript_19585/g.45063 Transcript_19585/m.45063 type:complete len:291 (+) Transcript_19585:61-933(+)|eukprot:CAMPEP_0172004088 /NCGR_PEP_ID=MMETSP1041-20130122/4277_1 /TAXON_ID=464988 /ORGANISM="Hemiselmis andersenii, Strain CCMP439" /LENGTH=290 /DNA_ID=CAMNT_0012657893 /DNA_START=44 /DNA_END=916 /DNA_ORIENTATION=+